MAEHKVCETVLQLEGVGVSGLIDPRYYNILLLSGIGDGREAILQTKKAHSYSVDIHSQFSHNTGLFKKTVLIGRRRYNLTGFYYHLLL